MKFITDMLTRVAYPGEPTKPSDVTSLDDAYHGLQHCFHIISCKRLKVKSVIYSHEKRPVVPSKSAFSLFLLLSSNHKASWKTCFSCTLQLAIKLYDTQRSLSHDKEKTYSIGYLRPTTRSIRLPRKYVCYIQVKEKEEKKTTSQRVQSLPECNFLKRKGVKSGMSLLQSIQLNGKKRRRKERKQRRW